MSTDAHLAMTDTVTPPRRRWYQFSLRTMFVLVSLLSIPLAWVGYSISWIRQRHLWINKGIGILSSPSVVPPRAPGVQTSVAYLGEQGMRTIIVSGAPRTMPTNCIASFRRQRSSGEKASITARYTHRGPILR